MIAIWWMIGTLFWIWGWGWGWKQPNNYIQLWRLERIEHLHGLVDLPVLLVGLGQRHGPRELHLKHKMSHWRKTTNNKKQKARSLATTATNIWSRDKFWSPSVLALERWRSWGPWRSRRPQSRPLPLTTLTTGIVLERFSWPGTWRGARRGRSSSSWWTCIEVKWVKNENGHPQSKKKNPCEHHNSQLTSSTCP